MVFPPIGNRSDFKGFHVDSTHWKMARHHMGRPATQTPELADSNVHLAGAFVNAEYLHALDLSCAL
jgi:hypothetical protein